MRIKLGAVLLAAFVLVLFARSSVAHSQSGKQIYLPAVAQNNTLDAHAQGPNVTGAVVQIVGGQDAQPGEYPWQAYVQIASRYQCGGVLIDPEWVLTAAHCVLINDNVPGQYYGPSDVILALGKNDITRFETAEQVKKVSQVIVHPDFDITNLNSDLTLLKLTTPATLNSRVNIIRLTTSPADDALIAPGVLATVTGWGTLTGDKNSAEPAILQEVSLPIVSNDVCRQAMRGVPISLNQLCAGYAQGGKDACYGDSGGPLIVPDGAGGWKLAGTVSFGIGCAQPNRYGVYVRVAKFANWIEQHTRPLTISGFVPTSANAGVKVTISGSGFLNAAQVDFNGVTATFDILSDAAMRAIVPPGARTGPISVVTSAATTVSAGDFVPLHILTIEPAGRGDGTVHLTSPSRDCASGNTCRIDLLDSATASLHATAGPSFVFAGWLGDCSGIQDACQVIMDGDKQINPVFAPPTSTLAVTTSGTGSGIVTGPIAGINCGVDCRAQLGTSSSLTLSARPGAGSFLASWSGACTGRALTCVVTMIGDRTVHAEFDKWKWTYLPSLRQIR